MWYKQNSLSRRLSLAAPRLECLVRSLDANFCFLMVDIRFNNVFIIRSLDFILQPELNCFDDLNWLSYQAKYGVHLGDGAQFEEVALVNRKAAKGSSAAKRVATSSATSKNKRSKVKEDTDDDDEDAEDDQSGSGSGDDE